MTDHITAEIDIPIQDELLDDVAGDEIDPPVEELLAAPAPSDKAESNVSARHVAEQMLAWASAHHMLDPLAITGQSAVTEGQGPNDGTLLQQQGNMVHTLRAKQLAGVLYNEPEKTVYLLTRRRISATALKTMPGWHAGITLKYLHFGQAQVGGMTQPSDGESYRELNERYCCGSSIHPARHQGAGTLGCLLRDSQGKLYGLSANHVSGLANYADAGEKILAPGHSDITPNGRDPFTIGVHVRALPMNHGMPANVAIDDNTDAAVFEIRNPDAVSSFQGTFYDTPPLSGEPRGGMLVEKVGRTTGYTSGRIIGASPNSMAVGYQLAAVGGNATVYFNNLMMVIGDNGTPFSAPGDSGSLVVGQAPDGSPCAVGMIIAGTNTGYSLILPVQPILEALDMTLVSQHNA